MNDRGQLLRSHDGCPLADHERRFGHRAQTVAVALDLARTTDQLVFAPAIAARLHLARRSLVEIRVEGWNVEDACNVVCHADRLRAHVQRGLVALVRGTLAEL